jgi:Tfp pilus assembly PilM family ATPase
LAFGLDKLASINPFGGGGIVAIDFGSQALKALQVTPGEPGQLVAAACLQTPPELANDANKRFEFQCDQLPTLMKSAAFRAKRAVVAIPASQMFSKHLQVQPVERQTIEQAAAQMIAAQLGCDESQLVTRCTVVAGANVTGKTEVIGLATASGLVTRVMQALKGAKLEVVGMQSEFAALLNAFRPVNRRTTDKDLTTLYLDIGAGSTKVAIGHATDLVFAKAFSMGGRFLDQCVAQQAKCSQQEARALRMGLTTLSRPKAAAPPAPTEDPGLAAMNAAMRAQGATATAQQTTPAQAAHQLASSSPASAIDLTDSLRALTDEIALCLRYYETIFPGRAVGRAIFVGGESRHVPLCQHIARTLRLPAHAADPLARIARTGQEPCAGVDLTQPQPGWAVPMGLLNAPTDC